MRELNPREKRTVLIGAATVAIYLTFFLGLHGWKSFSKQRSGYEQLLKEAQTLERELKPYESKVLQAKKLMEAFRFDPAKLNKATVVAEASAAIQRAALAGGIQVGAIREENNRGSARELASIKLEGNGPVVALLGFLSRLEGLGYPLLIDSVQIGSESGRPAGTMGPGGPMPPMGGMGPQGPPGRIKFSLTIVILDFELWHNGEVPNA